MPAPLKEALVRETARRESNVNDVAPRSSPTTFDVAYTPTGRRRKVLAGSSPVLLLRVPDDSQARAGEGRSARGHERQRPHQPHPRGRPRRAAQGLTKGHHVSAERQDARLEGQGARRHHRRRQLRQLAAPGRRVLQGRVARGRRPGPHARRSRRVPHLRHRVHGRVRRRQGQGRRRPRRRHLGAPERHDQVRRREEDRHHRLPRHDARRHRQVPRPRSSRRRRATRTTSSASSRRPARTSSSTTCPSAPRRRRSGTRSRSSTPAWRW